MHMKRVLAILLSVAMIVSSGTGNIAYAQDSAAQEISIVSDESIVEASNESSTEEELSGEVSEEASEDSSEAAEAASEASSDETEEVIVVDSEEESAAEASSLASSEDSSTTEVEVEVDSDAEFDDLIPSNCFGVTEDGTLTLKSGEKLTPTVVIPATAKTETGDTKDVVRIPDNIFQKDKTVRIVKFMDGSKVTEIAPEAFSGCTTLEEIHLPNSLTKIADGVFTGCSSLKIVELGTDVESIGKGAFSRTAITSIRGKKVKTLGENAFLSCRSLNNADFPVLEEIGDGAFMECSNLGSSMAFPSTLKKVGDSAFSGCAFTTLDLTSITSVVEFGDSAFENNVRLTSVKLPDTLEVVSSRMFYGCKQLSTLVMGTASGMLWKISTSAFENCSSLKTVTFFNVKNVEDKAFEGCNSLETIIFKYQGTNDSDFVISEAAFPEKSGVTIKGFDGKVQVYAEKRGYKFVSLYDTKKIQVKFDSSKVKVKGSVSEAAKGTEVKVTVTPVEGFALKNIEILEDTPTDIKFVDADDTSLYFSFTMPDTKVLVNVEMIEKDKALSGALSFDRTPVNGYSPDKDNKTLTFDVAGRESQLVIFAGNVLTNSWLWRFSSNNNAVATVTNTGLIRTVANGKATITATYRADESKKISITVLVSKSVEIANVVLNLSTPARAKASSTVIDGETVPVIEFERSTVNAREYTFPVAIKAYTADEPTRNLCIKSNWSVVDSSIVGIESSSVSSNKNNVTVRKGAVGETLVTVSIKNKGESKATKANTKSFVIRIVDATPRIKNSSITVNSRSEVGTELKVTTVYGYEISGESLSLYTKSVKSGVTTYNPFTDLSVKYDYSVGKYYIINTAGKTFSATYDANKPLFAKGRFAETGESFTIALPAITVTDAEINPTITMSGKINLFYTGAANESEAGKITLKQSLKDYEIEEYKLVSEANYKKEGSEKEDSFDYNYSLEKISNQEFVIKRKDVPMMQVNKKNVTSGYIYLKFKGFSGTVKKQIKLSTVDTAPNYVLKTASATASAFDKNQTYELEIVNKKDKKEVLDLSNLATGITESGNDAGLGLTVATTDGLFKELDSTDARTSGKIKLTVNGYPKKGKAVFYVQMEKWGRPLQFTFNLNVSSATPKATAIASSATLNKAYASKPATLTFTQNMADAELVELKNLTFVGNKNLAYDAEKLVNEAVVGASTVTFKLPSSDVKTGTYKFKVTPKVNYKNSGTAQELAAVAFNVVVVDKRPSIKLKNATFTLNALYPGKETVETTYTLGNLPTGVTGTVDAEKVSFVPGKGAPSFESVASITFVDGKAAVTLKDSASPFRGKTLSYTVNNLKVKADTDEDVIPAFTIKLKLTNKEPSVTVKAAGSLNPLDVNSKITYTATLKNVVSKVTSLDVWEIDPERNRYYQDDDKNNISKHFAVSIDPEKSTIAYLTAKDTNIQNGKKYTLKFVYTLEATGEKEHYVNITVTPKQAIPSIKVTTDTTVIYAGQRDRSFKVTVADAPLKKGETAPNVKMVCPDFASGTSDAIKTAFKITGFDADKHVMTVELVNPSVIAQDKDYTLNFVTQYESNDDKPATGSKFSVKVTVKK